MTKNYTDVALIDVAYDLLRNDTSKKARDYKSIFADVAKALGLSESELTEKRVQFYTDLNIDGRFMCNPEKLWGLKVWFLVDQIDEEIVAVPKTRKKKSKVVEDDFDSIEEIELEEYIDVDEDYEDDDNTDDEEDEEEEIEVVEETEVDDFEVDDDKDEDEIENIGESLEELASEELDANDEDEELI